MAGCYECDVCGETNSCGSCCNNPCIEWGFDDCFLRGRCADGTELTPLDLCAWLKVHETCTDFRLVPNTETGAYMQFTNECGEEEKIYVCDFLSLGTLECLGNVYDRDPAKPCDLLVFDPNCGDELSPTYQKWTHYTIPDAGNCVMEPDEEGYFKVLVKDHDGCGCIKECRLFATSQVWEYTLRDSWPDDPDWPFSIGSRRGNDSEIIDLKLEKIPMFGKSDLEVTFQYGYGIQNTGSYSTSIGDYNFKSIVTPTKTPTHTPDVTETYSKAIVLQGVNDLPYGSHEWQASRTVVVPRGQKLFLNHTIEVRDINGGFMPFGGESNNPTQDSSRLHALHVFVRAVKGQRITV